MVTTESVSGMALKRAERRAQEAEEKARRKREKEERAELEIAEAYENSRFRFKPPSVGWTPRYRTHAVNCFLMWSDCCAAICR